MAQKFIDRDPDLTPAERVIVERARKQREAQAMLEAKLAAMTQRVPEEYAA